MLPCGMWELDCLRNHHWRREKLRGGGGRLADEQRDDGELQLEIVRGKNLGWAKWKVPAPSKK